MFNLNLFIISLLLFGIVTGFLSLFTIYKLRQPNLSKIEKLPRNIVLGVIFAVADIAWCAPQAVEIFSKSSFFIVWAIAIIALIVGCFFLDYLFARALAGFLILLAHYFLRASFAADIPVIWLFSIVCLIMGTLGIFFGGIPHLFRDLLRKLCKEKKWRNAFSCIFALYSVISVAIAVYLIIIQNQ